MLNKFWENISFDSNILLNTIVNNDLLENSQTAFSNIFCDYFTL